MQRPFKKEITDITPARRAAIKAQKVTKPKKETLEEISINEKVDKSKELKGLNTPKHVKIIADNVSEKPSTKRKRKSPTSTRSTRSKFIFDETTTDSVRSTRSKSAIMLENEENLKNFFQDESSFEEEEIVIMGQDATWFQRVWNGVMSTVFFL